MNRFPDPNSAIFCATSRQTRVRIASCVQILVSSQAYVESPVLVLTRQLSGVNTCNYITHLLALYDPTLVSACEFFERTDARIACALSLPCGMRADSKATLQKRVGALTLHTAL
mmetsp:Transcript_97103/g.142091  ORF Transcript_97103/g.142091 Transcript_97103/m.142091 type:complete len:114 (-) Transcript_97103:13-354(-)